MKILLSINPPYSQMIVDEYKRMEFRNTAPKDILKNVVVLAKQITLYFYETKNQGGCGKIIGEAELLMIHKLNYKSFKSSEISNELKETREHFLNKLYEFYCFIKQTNQQNPNQNGLEKFIKLRKYQYEIGFNFDVDYAWEFTNIKKYDTPKELEEYGIKRAPQSWCFIEKDETNAS